MRNILAAAALLGVSTFAAAGAHAHPQCDERDAVLEFLQQKYKEQPVALGVTHNGGLVEVLTTGDDTTWSIIVTTPQGMSCLVAAGEGWKVMQRAAAADPGA